MALRKRKCRFFGTCASFEAGGGPKKTQYVVPPLSQIPGSAPDLSDSQMRYSRSRSTRTICRLDLVVRWSILQPVISRRLTCEPLEIEQPNRPRASA